MTIREKIDSDSAHADAEARPCSLCGIEATDGDWYRICGSCRWGKIGVAAAEAEVAALKARFVTLEQKWREKVRVCGHFSEWHPNAAQDLKDMAAGQGFMAEECANDLLRELSALTAAEPTK